VRQQSRRVPYPSLRFLRQSQLAAFRRRTIQDALLLLCRAAIVVVSALALAGPVLQTPSRSAGYADRLARAVIVLPGAEPAAGEQAAGDAWAARTFVREEVADAIADAARWLGEQPPAAREVVFVGAFRRGRLTPGHLRAVPASAGIRFVAATTTTASRDVTLPVLIARHGPGEGPARRDGGLVIQDQLAHLDDESTQVSDGAVTPVAGDAVRIIAAPADQSVADAALRAALAVGVRWSDPSRRVLIVWAGADEAAVQRIQSGASLVRMELPALVSQSASAVAVAVERLTALPLEALEPVAITGEQLQAWSRPPRASPPDARPVDEGDRRWLWGLVLALLAVEHWLRRSRPSPAAESTMEARVA
jgi:hypothetical protein